MLQLPHACKCSEPSVFPKNWDTSSAKVKKDWRIQYYFYDAAGVRTLKVLKKNINIYKTLPERQEAVKTLMEDLLHLLQVEGLNPVTGIATPPPIDTDIQITAQSGFISALEFAKEKITAEPNTKKDLKSVIKYSTIAAKAIKLNFVPIGEIKRKQIKMLMDSLGKVKKCWTNNNQNFYRSHLQMLFEELMEWDAIDTNPVSAIKKKKHTGKKREVVTDDQRSQIDKYLKENNYRFWRLVHIFFHSGLRETELLRIQQKHVNLERQTFDVLIKKGKDYVWHTRTIKSIVMPLWREAIHLCTNPEMFIFHEDLLPALADKPIRSEQITRRWRRWVKIKLGITADFYSLKHLHTTEVVELLDDKAAAKFDGHTSTAMVNNVYDIRSGQRKNDQVKTLENKFA